MSAIPSLRSAWHAVAAAGSLKDWPLGLSLLDEPVVIVRLNGRAVALRDVCAHMDSSLSGGWVMRGARGEELVCPHHRWRYDDAGRCAFIPELGADQTVPDWARVARYGAQESHGLIWVCLDEPAPAVLPAPAEFDNPAWRVCPPQARVWKMPAQAVVERFAGAAGQAIGAGHAVPLDSPVAAGWADPAAGAAILFAVCPINRSASRSFWVGAYPAGTAAADGDEALHTAVCQLCLAA